MVPTHRSVLHHHPPAPSIISPPRRKVRTPRTPLPSSYTSWHFRISALISPIPRLRLLPRRC